MMLTDEQRNAVEAQAREVLVIAPAGSGKTRVLVRRIHHLLTRRGASPVDLMVLTFTRAAAAEMQARLERLLADDGIEDPARYLTGMRIGTFHSIALQILRRHGDRLGYVGESLIVLDESDSDLLIREAARDLGHLKADGKWRGGLSLRQIRRALEQHYSSGIYRPPNGNANRNVEAVMRTYLARLSEYNALDYGQILLQCHRLFVLHPAVKEALSGHIRYLLVDEYQDCDALQHDLLDLFAPDEFYAVGDPRQSIYGFRGARPDLMLSARPNAGILDLRQCYRCGNEVVTAANALIAYNPESHAAKPMVGATGRQGRCEILNGPSAEIARCLQRFHDAEGYDWADMAVLARTHRTLRRLAEVFAEQDIPHHRVGAGFDICSTEPFRRWLAAMQLIVDHGNNLAFMRIRNELFAPPHAYSAIRALAAEEGIIQWDAMYSRGHDVYWTPTDLARAIADPQNAELDAFLSCRATAENNIRDFWRRNCAGLSVRQALDWYALRDAQDDRCSRNAVTLSTIHAAKGLEWPAVILVEMNEGTMPSSRSLKEDGGLEEERRLCYVAMTRARERLMLHYRRPEDQAEGREPKPMSRFVAETHVAPSEESRINVGESNETGVPV